MAASSITERFVLRHGDITTGPVDAIVNAANSRLAGGGGVDGAIHRAGGATILAECQAWVANHGPLATGDAMLTTAGELPAAHVIHTVGPVWGLESPSDSDDLLASAYRTSLTVAANHNIESIAFPNISTGIFGFPKARAAEVAITTVRVELAVLPSIERVTFVCHDTENYELYEQLLLREV